MIIGQTNEPQKSDMANFYSLFAAIPYAVVSDLQIVASLSPLNKVWASCRNYLCTTDG